MTTLSRALAAVLFLASPTLAQNSTPAQIPPAVATVRAVRAAPASGINVDGRIDEAAWSAATPAADFVQQSPNPGSPATQRTEVRVLVDGEALYVAARLHDTAPDSILAQLTRRDQGSTSDGFRVFVDSYHDRRTAFVFGLNPRGVKDDFMRFNDGEGIDYGWDAVWEGAARVDSAGWTAEFRIPLGQLRFQAERAREGAPWGVNFRRYIARNAEASFWAAILPNQSGFVSRFGDLSGLEAVRNPARMEVLPYTSATLDRARADDDDPFGGGGGETVAAGGDVKMGLPGGLTLSATINPDFGQVELDPAVVNLTAFESFFEERRPFFVEGADIFRFGDVRTFNNYGFTQFFYSRRVGRSPQGGVNVADAEFTDAPTATTILGAVKVSGKTGPWSIGLLDALTDRETARWQGAGQDGSFPVEPLANYFVGRVRRDLRGGRSVVGALATSTYRDLRGDEFDGWLRDRSSVAGVDFEHTWSDRLWALSGFLAASQVHGSADAILATQTSPAHEFDRPDAGHLSVDPERTTLNGSTGSLSLQRAGNYDLSLTYKEVSPGYESNDLGFHGRVDYRAFSTFLGRRISNPHGAFRDHSFYAYTNQTWNFDGNAIYEGIGLGLNGTLKSLWYMGGSFSYNAETFDDRLTRGGPLALSPAGWNGNFNLGTDSRKRVSAGVFGGFGRDDAGGWSENASLSVDFRPSSAVQVSIGPSWSRSLNTTQYVTGVNDALAAGTFGRRHVFAELDQTVVSMNTRVDWTFSPTLSLQIYAQPFVAVGDFAGLKEFAEPRTLRFGRYGENGSTVGRGPDCATPRPQGAPVQAGDRYLIDPDGAGPAACFAVGDRDFNVRSLRGNAVLRWEYRPGSTLFFVWQQERGDEGTPGHFRPSDLTDALTAPARNVFLIKATYWLSR